MLAFLSGLFDFKARRLAKARATAWKAWAEAKHRRDTRREHEAYKAYRTATHEALRWELGR